MTRLITLGEGAKRAGLVATVGLLLNSSACYVDPGGPDYASIELSATDAAGKQSNSVCTVLPVLLGSRVLNDASFSGGFGATIYASAAGAKITFGGAQNASQLNRFISAERLRDGVAQQLSVQTTDGRMFAVFIASGCTE